MLSISEFCIKTLNFCSMFAVTFSCLSWSFICFCCCWCCVFFFCCCSVFASLLLPEFNLKHDSTSNFCFTRVRSYLPCQFVFFYFIFDEKFQVYSLLSICTFTTYIALHWTEIGRFYYIVRILCIKHILTCTLMQKSYNLKCRHTHPLEILSLTKIPSRQDLIQLCIIIFQFNAVAAVAIAEATARHNSFYFLFSFGCSLHLRVFLVDFVISFLHEFSI